MPVRPCLRCGRLGAGSYCAQHDPNRTRRRDTPGRGGGSRAAAFRKAVLRQAGHRCEAVVGGVHCEVTDPGLLEAQHLRPLRQGGTNDPETNGVLLCQRHHREAERTTAA